jgi:hypothetical protein
MCLRSILSFERSIFVTGVVNVHYGVDFALRGGVAKEREEQGGV